MKIGRVLHTTPLAPRRSFGSTQAPRGDSEPPAPPAPKRLSDRTSHGAMASSWDAAALQPKRPRKTAAVLVSAALVAGALGLFGARSWLPKSSVAANAPNGPLPPPAPSPVSTVELTAATLTPLATVPAATRADAGAAPVLAAPAVPAAPAALAAHRRASHAKASAPVDEADQLFDGRK